MNIYLISDNIDTRVGLRLVGIDGVVVHNLEELKEKLNYVISSPNIAILLIAENLAKKFPDIIDEIKLTKKLPLIVEIPDRHGTGRQANFVSSYIREATGIKI